MMALSQGRRMWTPRPGLDMAGIERLPSSNFKSRAALEASRGTACFDAVEGDGYQRHSKSRQDEMLAKNWSSVARPRSESMFGSIESVSAPSRYAFSNAAISDK